MDAVTVMVAVAPLTVVIVLLVLRVRAWIAAAVGLLIATVATATIFTAPYPVFIEGGARMLPTIVTVAAILLGGVTLSHIMVNSGAQDVIADAILARCGNGIRALLLIVFGITPFAESVTGFGLGVIVAIPLLRRLGHSPARSAVIALLGLVLVPWGSLGPGTLVAASLGNISFHDLGVWSAVLTLPVLLAAGTAILLTAYGRAGLSMHWAPTLAVAVFTWGVLCAANLFLETSLAGVLTSLTVLGLLATVKRSHAFTRTVGLIRALSPYALLTVGLLSCDLVLREAPSSPWVSIATSPATWLLLTACATPALLRIPTTTLPRLLRRSVAAWIPLTATTVLFLILGALMATNGMSESLAAAAAHLGPAYAALAPLIGAVGGYVTGSNTGASAMFAGTTSTAATTIGLDPVTVLAGQNVAGSYAIIASPARIALATTIAGTTLTRNAHRTLALTLTSTITALAIATFALTGT